MPAQAAPILGTFFHTIGAGCAALCYAPHRYVRRWSWQTYWIVQAGGCWLVLPWIFAWLTIPQLGSVLHEAPSDAMLRSYLLGVLYGIGGIAFGVAIRYIGYSLTYAIAIGVSCVLGTLLPPLIAGTLFGTLRSAAGNYVVFGVLLGTGAILATGLAGFRKEREIAGDAAPGSGAFNPRLGLPIVLVAGVLSAVFSFSLAAGQPIADVAARHGAGDYQGNVIYLFSNTGAFTTTLFYSLWLICRGHTWSEFVSAAGVRAEPEAEPRDAVSISGSGGAVAPVSAARADRVPLARNYALSLLTGLLWYLQFFFYGRGHVHMGRFQFSSWAIHMIILILLSCGFGVAIGEWKACRPSTKFLVSAAIALLLGAVGLISAGNYLASVAA